ncbi:hypothetical protein SAMN06265795_104249 [Noviherbaspirillum humi]|uniref:Uncharacterized protein n=1 Tax=Noviherbaspirillum humi TaxID=1688639 RepID=A0A239G4L3_9BURK|nr:hypothetical protein [Noviherbaspirillum humi]SNS64097.1 hypothetical protein SAMN06265795_104249 [Noviherbaspirillum humi]
MNEATQALLRDAYAIIDGIPEDAIRFGPPVSRRGPSLAEGTICSPEGWLAQHPDFISRGLRLSDDDGAILFQDEASPSHGPALPMAGALDLSLEEAGRLFGSREALGAAENGGLSDKGLWLKRVRDMLASADGADVPETEEPASSEQSIPV